LKAEAPLIAKKNSSDHQYGGEFSHFYFWSSTCQIVMAQEFRRLIAETAILNTEKSFELKAIEGSQMSIEGFSRVSELMLRRT